MQCSTLAQVCSTASVKGEALRGILLPSNPRNKASSLHSTHPSPTSLRGRNYCRSLALPARLPAILDLLLFVLLEGRFGCLFMYIDSEGQHALSEALGENIYLLSL
jgi:hypothetical protein